MKLQRLVPPNIEKNIKSYLIYHGITFDEQGEQLLLTYPEGTKIEEKALRVSNAHNIVTLPNGVVLEEEIGMGPFNLSIDPVSLQQFTLEKSAD